MSLHFMIFMALEAAVVSAYYASVQEYPASVGMAIFLGFWWYQIVAQAKKTAADPTVDVAHRWTDDPKLGPAVKAKVYELMDLNHGISYVYVRLDNPERDETITARRDYGS